MNMNTKTKEEAIAAYATMSKEYADTIDKATELLDDLFNIDSSDAPVAKRRAKRKPVAQKLQMMEAKLNGMSEDYIQVAGLAMYHGHLINMELLRLAVLRLKRLRTA